MAKLRKGTISLSVSNPMLCKDWDYEKNAPITPNDVTSGSNQKAWWICSKGHSWTATVGSRNSGSGCPYCSGRYAISGETDLQTLYPNIAKEWHPTKNGQVIPTEISAHSPKKAWWLCPKGHSYESSISNRVDRNDGCPYCSGKRTLKGYNDFETWCRTNRHSELLQEWDYEKNSILPSEISPKNNKKVWWKCPLGHEWDAAIGSRTSGRPSGCPFCSNPPKKILVGFNDFETWCLNNGKEQLLAEWNAERNTEFSPKDISYGCGKRVWWRCQRGHEWCVSPSNRVQGTGCPICSRTQTSFPEQAIAYYLSKDLNVLQRYSIKGFEIDVFLEDFNIGIEYDGMYFHTSNNSKRDEKKDSFYKEQGIRLIRVKENTVKTGIVNDTVYYIPLKSNYLDDSFNKMLCSLISVLETHAGVTISKDIDIVRDELAVREHYASIIKNSSVAAVYPELIPEWDVEKNRGMTPDNFSANSHTKVWWRCKNGHTWQADISSRNRKLGCPYCAGQRTIRGENDLESWCKTNNPTLLLEWDFEKNKILPSEVSKTSNRKFWWTCSKGHEWEASIANRIHGTRCPVCYTGNDAKRYSVSFAQWCKDNNYEHLLSEWDYSKNASITPDTVSKASHIKVWWKCDKGHEWEAQIKSRTYNHGCPYCSGTNKKAVVGKNDLVTWCKENDKQYILNEWDYDKNDGMMPEQFTFGSHKRINWKCSKGHTWSAVIKERTKYRGNMCPECNKSQK